MNGHTHDRGYGHPHGDRLDRLRALGPRQAAAEVAWRVLRTTLHLAADAAEHRRPSRTRIVPMYTPFLLADRTAEGLPTATTGRVGRDALAACLAEADRALRGTFDILGYGPVSFARPPRWHDDPVTGHRWTADRHCQQQVRPGLADIKVPWEASRMAWLVALARASRYTGDPAWRLGAIGLLEDWAAANPAGCGPNWANAMEAGIRCINLCWAAEIFADPEFSSRVAALLGGHTRFIATHLEYSPRLTSNHYLADLAGLIHAGAGLRRTPTGRAALRFGAQALAREIVKQFYADGTNFEASTIYARLSTELAVCGIAAAQGAGLQIRPHVADRVASALRALETLTGLDGRLPAIGDDDSGLAVGLASGRDPRDPGPIISAGRVILGLAAATDDWHDELSDWLAGASSRPVRAIGFRTLPDGGLYRLDDGHLWCLMDCGNAGQRGNGGHGHSDNLSIVVGTAAGPLITDPGTGNYTFDPHLRNRLRSTGSHATVMIDRESQHIIDKRLFAMAGDVPPAVELAVGAGAQQVVAHHDAYRRLSDPVRHRRTIRLDHGRLEIHDELICQKSHVATIAFPLGMAVRATGADHRWELQLNNDRIVFLASGPGELRFRLIDQPVSPAYGRAERGHALVAEIRVDGTTAWTITLTLEPSTARERMGQVASQGQLR